MLPKYVSALKDRAICSKTGEVWRIQDVPNLWRSQAKQQVLEDGYVINDDGTVTKPEAEQDVERLEE